jgi:cell division protein FtsB
MVTPAAATRATHVTFKAMTLVAGILAVIFVSSFFFSGRGTAELQLARKRVADLQADIHRLDAENMRLRNEIDSVRRSTYTVERIAREELGMSKRGEVIYLLPKK